MRAPGITPRPAHLNARIVDVRFPPATRDEERAGTYYPMHDCSVLVRRNPYDCQPKVYVREVAPGNLECDELAALGALADIRVEAEWEECSPDGHFSNDELVDCPDDCPLGEDGLVRADVLDVWRVKRGIKSGNVWAWCTVTVTARWLGHEGSDSLGACSYGSEQEFRRPGGYYDDMVKNALQELRDAIEASAK